jgi:hypothetical protein
MSVDLIRKFDGGVRYSDSPNLDAFQRLRVASPTFNFDAQFTYDLQSLLYQQITAQSGATITHNSTERVALMTFASTPTGGQAYMQSFSHFRYQAGRSQFIAMAFNFINTAANVLKFAGYSTGGNGIEFQQDGTTVQIVKYSGTSLGNITVTQSNWNLDKLNGTGPSGITLDLTKVQVLVIDFSGLYGGRVRVGFMLNGKIIYAHEFLNSNLSGFPSFQSLNLPIRCGMTCTATVSTTMHFICATVSGESGEINELGFSRSQEGAVTAGSGVRTHILSLRPRLTFNSIVNRTRFRILSLEIIITLGINSALWEVVLGQAITGTTAFTDVNTTYSAMEFNTAGTISGSPAVVLSAGYVTATNQAKVVVERVLSIRSPITLDAAGAHRALGTLSFLVTGIGGTAPCRMSVDWEEIR